MDEKQKTLLEELSEAMAKMPNDPQGVAGWLLTNYRFQKIGSGEPVDKFHRKGGGGGGIVDTSALKTDPDYDKFLGRTDQANKVRETMAKIAQSKNSKLAQFAAEITSMDDPYGEEGGGSHPQSLEEVDAQMDQEDMETMRKFREAGVDPFKASGEGGIIQARGSRGQGGDIGGSEMESLIAYAKKLDQNELLPEEQSIASTEKGAAVLQKDRFKRIKAQQALQGAGPIRRSD